MKQFLLYALVSSIIVSGCGQRLENSIYDTATNPDSLPSMACELLDRIAFGRMATADSVTAGFNQLYTQHSELFENETWRGIITTMGPLFASRADSLTAHGPLGYTEAAKYYLLASLARPDNPEAYERSHFFEGWLRAVEMEPQATTKSDASMRFDEIMRTTRLLMLGDSVQQRFGREMVVNRYLDSLIEQAESDTVTFGPADRALLTWLGSAEVGSFEVECSFGDPPILLVAHEATPWGEAGVMIELYFRSEDSGDSFQAVIPYLGTDGADIFLQSRKSPGSSGLWLASGPIPFMRPFQDLSIGLRSVTGEYLTVSGTADQWYATLRLGEVPLPR